jgi:hypothetical protein
LNRRIKPYSKESEQEVLRLWVDFKLDDSLGYELDSVVVLVKRLVTDEKSR